MVMKNNNMKKTKCIIPKCFTMQKQCQNILGEKISHIKVQTRIRMTKVVTLSKATYLYVITPWMLPCSFLRNIYQLDNKKSFQVQNTVRLALTIILQQIILSETFSTNK